VGRSQFHRALLRSQPSGSRPWHPCCRRCLLKGCERWFLSPWTQARYCSPACQEAARRWRVWHAGQVYRATPNGKQHRCGQNQRYRSLVRQRSCTAEPAPPAPHFEPASPAIEPETLPVIDPLPETAPAIEPPPEIPMAREGQRPREIPENFAVQSCSRPGCYVLFFVPVLSDHQRFCSGLCRRALRRVRQREARLRLRRRRGVRPLRHSHRGPPQATSFMSSHD
jgi:hypothetical protein